MRKDDRIRLSVASVMQLRWLKMLLNQCRNWVSLVMFLPLCCGLRLIGRMEEMVGMVNLSVLVTMMRYHQNQQRSEIG